LQIFYFLDRGSDNKVSFDELNVAWTFALPIKNNEQDIDKWKMNVYMHFCVKDAVNGCTFREFVDLLDEMYDVHLRNVMRNYIKAL
jgi:hypothetical protein